MNNEGMPSWAELLETYTELRGERDRLGAELTRRFPQGFTGNGVPGDFEGLELDYSDAEAEFHSWMNSPEGIEFKRLRAERNGA